MREILVIGKIGWEVRTGDWDEIVVDGPATGHVVELLDAPRTMAELVPTGPLAEQTGWLREILAADHTEVIAVSSPDELSVSETGELIERLTTETETALGLVVANRVPPTVEAAGRTEAEELVAGGHALAPLAALALDRHQVAAEGIARLSTLGPTTSGLAGSQRSDEGSGDGEGDSDGRVALVADDPADPVGAAIEALDRLTADPDGAIDGDGR